MNNSEKIKYLSEAILYQTANDIYLLPRPEFVKEVKAARDSNIEEELIPAVVMGMCIQKENSLWAKIKRIFKCKK